MKLNYAIVFVSDMQRSVGFYRDVLGLPLKFETTHWTEFATGEATLALHISAAASSPDDQRELPPGRCRPGFSVPNLDEFHARMLSVGVPCVHEPREVSGVRIAQYADPDGLAISVAEEKAG